MNTVLMTIVLAGSTLASATQVTGRELALLRVILRQSMSMDRHAAYESGDALMKDRVSPLDLVLNDPNVDALHKIMTDEANDPYKRSNAARALAYLGDERCINVLTNALAGKFAASSSCIEQNQAGVCLLFLGYRFPRDFLFTRLPNPIYPELNALLEDPNRPATLTEPLYSERYNYSRDPNLPYTNDKIATIVIKHLEHPKRPVKIRGPLSTLEVEQREIANPRYPWVEAPLGGLPNTWRKLLDQGKNGDLLYYFITDEADWASLRGAEGYVLIRQGEVAAIIMTRQS